MEDDERIARLVSRALEVEGYAVDRAYNGLDALAIALDRHFDLLLLDLMLPGLDGAEVLSRVVEERPGQRVIVVSAIMEIGLRVACLDAGAVDFVSKPFALAELMARVRAHMREPIRADRPWLVVGQVKLDIRQRLALVADRRVDLSLRESLLLRHLMQRAGQACSRSELLADVWGLSFDPGSNVVDVCVRRLRGKLGTAARVETVRNVGYRLLSD
ncbi:response regulator transcription factor [Dactylosporangium sp. McL0621]|uniref:response regulator transcription factor n=1 Tax=Dactylosporangium sp. McL0621 TaxID=3415678 RepID=UPI003CE83149